MVEDDSFITHRDTALPLAMELSSVGFEDAEEIGRGGFGVVYRCTQSGLDRVVAVKVLTAQPDAEGRARFLQEQRAMGRLTGHPNIVGVLQIGEISAGRPYLVMQYYERGSLDARIRQDGSLPVDEVLRLGVKLAGALEMAHRLGIVHHDVKPANILFTDYGEPALADFGIAHVAGGFRTATGVILGSPAYTAPELLNSARPTPASDVYGLGATLFSALTGHAAFERRSGEQVVAQFLRITTEPLPDLREGGIPDDVRAVVEAAMSRDPRERPSMTALAEELQRIQHSLGLPVEGMALRGGPSGKPQVPARALPPAGVRRATSCYGKLPTALTSFVGRRTEVSKVRAALSAARLVTLVGIGGSGKTRLALCVAENAQRGFPDGVWLIELGDLHDEALVIGQIAATLGVRDRSTTPLREVLADALAPRTMLLVLDNCEQVIEAVAEVTGMLLSRCPNLHILATSREPLGIGGEAVLRVPPMATPTLDDHPAQREVARFDAVALFAERASAAMPGFEITEKNADTVARICTRLDGLPLAIELAAARVRALSPEQILQRLSDRYALLTSGSRDAPTRQKTLRLSIDASHDLCSPAEQQLWSQLTVFVGGLDLDAAEFVCGEDWAPNDLLDTMTALVDKSILIREEVNGRVRFRMLDTLRDYARATIEHTKEYRELCWRHKGWYERLALDAEVEWVGSSQLDWIARITRELPNLHAALEFSGSESDAAGLRIASGLYNFWTATGRYGEARRWCELALASTADSPAADRAKYLCMTSMFAATLGDLPAATMAVAELRTLAEDAPDSTIDRWFAYADGYTALTGGDLERAVDRLNDALLRFSADGEIAFKLRALTSLGWTHVLRGDMPAAIACLTEVLDVANSHGESYFRSFVLRPLALAVWQQGDPERAQHLLEEALRAARELADPLTAAVSAEILAWIACEQQDVLRAVVLLGAADELGRTFGGSSILYRHLLAYHQKCERRAHEVLGKREYASAFRKGTAMGFQEVLDFVLGERHEAAASAESGPASLTKRERQVADLVAEGLTNKEIAARLVISQRTAQGHVEHVLIKLGFRSRTQIAAWAVENSRRRE
ncbi:protein kinase [Nocardia sp. NPDC059239]|uniref:protein kinase domain-containing protein n=2 Tax=unclassified Nocardia TaxID=2637762 RepID=UPI0036AE8994